jgi:hypothetical protein
MVFFLSIRVAETWTPVSVIAGLVLLAVVAATITWLVYRS